MLLFYSVFSKWVIGLVLIANKNLASILITQKSSNSLINYKEFIQVLKSLDLFNQYPEILQNGSCFYIEGISVAKINSSQLSIVVTVKSNNSFDKKEAYCSDSELENIENNQGKSSTNTSKFITNSKKNDVLAISQTVGIIICALLLGIFFFIAGIMRLKNFLRRNNNAFKLSGLRSCLTNVDEEQKWRSSISQNNQSTISNYLQLQSVIDKNVSQFMMRSHQYSKPNEQESKRPNQTIKRKLSLKNKLLPKRLNNNQNSQRRYSLTNEIESVMNKHFNMIGVTRRYGSKSTQNIGGVIMTPSNRLSEHSMLNEININPIHKNATANNVNDYSSISSKSLMGRYHRYGNFPGRRATTIGGRSNVSRHKSSIRCSEKDSPNDNVIYSSQQSVVIPQSTKQKHLLRKQLTLQEGNEGQPYNYSLVSSKHFDSNLIKTYDAIDNEEQYLKVPFKSLNLLPNKKCIFNINDEKASPSPESRESNSRCSSFDKASSTWSSLEVHEEQDSKNINS